ncbi:hypothetical protein SCP_1800910 [Sparassis crispa]|uniref:Uncharacterized protein n=1 Tax=Sparassis crispa TaxID=139825 RepID=A0A401H6Q9_9APHY|nr:hypothetical protein SCP_1800910 [Sparassis crispa]GBE90069.1 hypothetical protein SCP_1800910 [Sparassis crispa]
MATAWSGHHQYGGIPLEIPTIRESVAEEPVEQEAEEEELLPLELEEPTLRPEDISLPRRHAALRSFKELGSYWKRNLRPQTLRYRAFDRAISPFYSSLSITGPNESGVAAWNTPAAFAFTAVR